MAAISLVQTKKSIIKKKQFNLDRRCEYKYSKKIEKKTINVFGSRFEHTSIDELHHSTECALVMSRHIYFPFRALYHPPRPKHSLEVRTPALNYTVLLHHKINASSSFLNTTHDT
jgi:hypothetical protein